MVFSKEEVEKLLRVLEEKYPKSYSSEDSLKKEIELQIQENLKKEILIRTPHIDPENLFKLLFFCWEAELINCTSIEEEAAGVVGFSNIRINSSGIRFLCEF
jgi:hypothetical protein